MTLREFLDGLPSIKDWAERHGLNPNLLSQYASDKTDKQPGPEMAKRISKATGGLVPLAALRDDIWG